MHAVHTLASMLLTSASSEVREALWLSAVERAASLLFSWSSKALLLETAAARSLSFFLALEQDRWRRRQLGLQIVNWPSKWTFNKLCWTWRLITVPCIIFYTCVWLLQAQREPFPGLSAVWLCLWQFHPKPVEHQLTLPHKEPSGQLPKENKINNY